MPLYLDAVVSMVSGYNACRVLHLTCILWQAVVSEQALFCKQQAVLTLK